MRYNFNKNERHIQANFIELDIDEMPFSLYLVRNSLLKAVNEFKNSVFGDVLDLGCGHMPYKNILLSDKVLNYIGVDLPPSIYHNQVQPDLIWDGITIPVADNNFDFVIATEFFEHYFDTDHILKEIKRILKPGGVLFFTVPSIWPIHEEPFDYHRFTKYNLEKHFSNNEFNSYNIYPLGGYSYSLAIMFGLYYDNVLKGRKKYLFKWFFKYIISFLEKKDSINFKIGNGKMHSGLYGYVTK
jgi:SAM-dependent methyltransferase